MSRGNSGRKRPIYIVVKPTGVLDEYGEEIEALIGVRQTSAGADILQKTVEGAIKRKAFLVDGE